MLTKFHIFMLFNINFIVASKMMIHILIMSIKKFALFSFCSVTKISSSMSQPMVTVVDLGEA